MLRLSSLASLLLLVGCADQGDEGMTVLNNTAIAGTECTLTGDLTQPSNPHGEINAFSPVGYYLTPLIQSRVTAAVGDGSGSSSVPPDLAQRTIFLHSADVTLTLKAQTIRTGNSFAVSQPNTNLGSFSTLFAGALPPDGSINVGFEVISPAIMIGIVQSSGVSSGLTAEVLAEVTIHGELGGDDVKSNVFQYPISVCTDCIVADLGPCPQAGANTGNACNMFQDGRVDCCEDATGVLVCPSK